MVTVDSTASPFRPKRRGRGAAHRKKRRHRIRSRSTRMVKTGRVDLTPCVACGATGDLTIHHVAPIRPDRFVFLCRSCHDLAHRPVFRTIQVCIAPGHFSIRPEALVRPTDIPALHPSMSPIRTAPVRKRPTSPRVRHSAPRLTEAARKEVPRG
jgi:hypothetical protein